MKPHRTAGFYLVAVALAVSSLGACDGKTKDEPSTTTSTRPASTVNPRLQAVVDLLDTRLGERQYKRTALSNEAGRFFGVVRSYNADQVDLTYQSGKAAIGALVVDVASTGMSDVELRQSAMDWSRKFGVEEPTVIENRWFMAKPKVLSTVQRDIMGWTTR